MDRKLLEVKNLTIEFRIMRGQLRAVNDVSFVLGEGRTVALVGESGSGKSVTARALIQILPRSGIITGGEILYHSYKAKDQLEPSHTELLTSYAPNSEEMRRVRITKMGMIFQEPMSALSPVHTCGDTISTAIKLRWPDLPRAKVREKLIEILDQLRIPKPEKTAGQYPFELSGGMRQRVCIALALVRKPEVLIADEPTTSLDVTTQKEILALIEMMKREHGLTVLFITHDLGVASQIADDVVVLQGGECVESGPAANILVNPRHAYTQRLITSALALERRAAGKTEFKNGERSEPVLKVHDLTMTLTSRQSWFKETKVQILDRVSFDLRRSETLGIVGESGSGKTTVARCLVGLYRGFEGSILFTGNGGESVELNRYKYKKADPMYSHIRLVFQDPFSSLNPRLNVYQNLAEPLLIALTRKREIEERVVEVLRRVELEPDMMRRYPHAFSGGQRQRICIARAIIRRPTVLIADEATSALDVSLRSRILDLLTELQKTMHFSIILITHDISTVQYCADRMIVMRHGKVVEGGGVHDVINSPQQDYTRTLMAAVPRMRR
jgi:peptide/nickel transport system ATP-binding protein